VSGGGCLAVWWVCVDVLGSACMSCGGVSASSPLPAQVFFSFLNGAAAWPFLSLQIVCVLLLLEAQGESALRKF